MTSWPSECAASTMARRGAVGDRRGKGMRNAKEAVGAERGRRRTHEAELDRVERVRRRVRGIHGEVTGAEVEREVVGPGVATGIRQDVALEASEEARREL